MTIIKEQKGQISKKLARGGLILFIFLAILIVGIALYFKLTRLSIERVLPEGPLIYFRFSDVQGDLEKFIATPFWKRFNDLDMEHLLEKGIINEKQKALLGAVRKQLPILAEHKMLKKMFGQEIAVAVYPPAMNAAETTDQLMENIVSKFFVVVRVKPYLQMAESLTPFASLNSQKFSFEAKEYRNHRIHILNLENNAKIVFTRLRDLLIVGVSEETVRISIDVFEGTKPSAADDPPLRGIKTRILKKATILAYLNMEGVFSFFIEQIKAVSALSQGQMNTTDLEMFIESLSGIKTITASARWDRLSQVKFDVWTDEEQIGSELKDFYARCKPRLNKSLEFVPADVLAYQWSECIDFKSQWQRLAGRQGKQGSMAPSRLNSFQEQLDINIEKDIVPLLEEEIGGYAGGIDFSTPIPIPALVLFIKITDQLKLESILKKLFEHYGLLWQEKDYSGISLKYIQFPLLKDLQPSFCFIGNYFLAGSKTRLLENAIDVYQKKSSSLLEDKSLGKLDKKFLEENTGMIFMRIDQLSGAMSSLFRWANDSLSSLDEQKEAFQKGGERRLQDLRLDLVEKGKELREMQESLSVLEEEIKNFQKQGQNIEGKQKEIDQLKADIDIKQNNLTSAREKEKESKVIVQGYDKEQKQARLRKTYFEEIFIPLWDDLKFFDSFGARTNRQGGVSESIFYLKLK